MISLDSAMNNDFLMISKSLVPYLDPDKQRAVAIFIKAFELMSTIDLFSKEEFVRSITIPRDTGWEKKFLNDIRTNLSDDRAYFIDAILKLSEVKDLLAVKTTEPYNSSYTGNDPLTANIPLPSSPDPNPQSTAPTNSASINKASDVIDKLSGVLEPNQLQILKVLSSFIK
ncbi:hypothetical protein [Cellulosilyticum sp. I15G10I2]|uniref:hypothetical protein n=1 Tax=Cellulosilyticum sp. I15G10I2 TaxID=1892843 RepID=UPI00085BDF87|nr:hypothetical protein [Cellulosilyticum sp. I15G10I2]